METIISSQISVCIPIYNVERYIEKCLRSVFEQTIADKAEFILVDDCSSDQSMAIASKIIDEYPECKSRVKIIHHEVNKGLAAARNTLLRNANGKYIIFVDSDDWCEPDYLEVLYNTAEKENADVVCCNLIKENENFSKQTAYFFPSKVTECMQLLIEGDLPGWLPIKFFKKELFDKNKIDWTEKIDLQEDLIISVKLFSKAEKIISVEKALYHYNQLNTGSLSVSRVLSDKKCRQIVDSVSEIERFLDKEQLLSEYKDAVKKRKILSKIIVLLKAEKKLRKQYYTLYKNEFKNLRNLNLKFKVLRFIMRLYDFHLYFLGNLCLDLIKVVKK